VIVAVTIVGVGSYHWRKVLLLLAAVARGSGCYCHCLRCWLLLSKEEVIAVIVVGIVQGEDC